MKASFSSRKQVHVKHYRSGQGANPDIPFIVSNRWARSPPPRRLAKMSVYEGTSAWERGHLAHKETNHTSTGSG